jgi:hypothetical protein
MTNVTRRAEVWLRLLLGVGGLVLLGAIVRHVGIEPIVSTLRAALPWVAVLAVVELVRIGCETVASQLAFGPLARRIPRATLFRAHVLGHSLSAFAPAPTVFNETIKATFITPYTGVGPAAAVGFVNQAAMLMANGLITIPCALAILVLQGASAWFWACAIHTVVLLSTGLALQAVARADGPGRWIARRFPRFEEGVETFREHSRAIRLGARPTTAMLLLGRCLQVVQYGIAAHAVGIDVRALRVAAAEGVHLVAMAVGVLVPGGLGTTEGAFGLAADLLDTTVARATATALLMRCMQIAWVLVGALVALLPRAAPPSAPTSPCLDQRGAILSDGAITPPSTSPVSRSSRAAEDG